MKVEYEKVYKANGYDDMRRCSIIHQVVNNINSTNSNPITQMEISMSKIIEIIKQDLENAKKTNSIRLIYLIEIETDGKTYANFWKVTAKDNSRKFLLCKITIKAIEPKNEKTNT